LGVSEEVKKCEEQCESEEKKQSECVSLSLSTLALFFVVSSLLLSNEILEEFKKFEDFKVR
jgi:hypothetical protein